MTDGIRAVFQRAGCEGTLGVQSLGGGAEVALRPDEPVIPASVIKVLIALEAETWFADGRLDPREHVTLSAAERTPGLTAACQRVRTLMARQLARHRLASAFRLPVQVAARSGSLLGVVRNEIGVISYPDGRQYAAAVFTRSRPGADDFAISLAIGTAASQAVTALHGAGA